MLLLRQRLVALVAASVWRMAPRELSTVIYAFGQLQYPMDASLCASLKLAITSKLARFNPQVNTLPRRPSLTLLTINKNQ
jgi:hypothetical protein